MIKPCHDFVLVKKLEKTEMLTEGGLYMPIQNITGSWQGSVIDTGPGIEREDGSYYKLPCAAGDQVIVRETSGETVMFCGETYMLVPAMEILAVVR